MKEKALKEAKRIHDELSQIDTIVSHVKRDWNEFVRTGDDAYLKAVAYDLQAEAEVEELASVFKVDLVDSRECSPELLKQVEEEGVEL